jgi:hypothetical protein
MSLRLDKSDNGHQSLVLNCFSSSFTLRENKLECLSPGKYFKVKLGSVVYP